MLRTREGSEQIRELEELWAAPAAPERVPPRRRLTMPRVEGWHLIAGWLGFFAMLLVFAPMPAENMATPLWGELLIAANLIALLAAAFLGVAFGRLGFGTATVAGCLGMAVAVACTTTGHHSGNWWLAELGFTAALTGVAAAGFGQRLRRK